MNVASLDLCKELYELSGWNDDTLNHSAWFDDKAIVNNAVSVPLYPLGYLLRKLPYRVRDDYQAWQYGVHLKQTGGSGWTIYYGEPGKTTEMYFNSATTPEDAACKLAIELIKKGVLK